MGRTFAVVKKVIILALAVLYIGITSGVMVNVHYCMGEIAGLNFGHDDSQACTNCGMEEKGGCCQTEHKLIKAGDEHLLAKSVSQTLSSVPAPVPAHLSIDAAAPLSVGYGYPPYHSPPDRRFNGLHVYNCVFRI